MISFTLFFLGSFWELETSTLLDFLLSPTFILPFFFLKLGMYMYYIKRKNEKLRLMQLHTIQVTDSFQQFQSDKESEIKNLKGVLREKENRLLQSNIDLQQKEVVLMEIEKSLKDLKNLNAQKKNEFRVMPLLHKIRNRRVNFDLEKAFLKEFEIFYPDFINKMKRDFPRLTNRDVRVCALIKLGKNTTEIANVLGIESLSADKIKYRIKKKMKLGNSIKLDQFIIQV